jgi:hypothetical protein
MLAPCGSLSTYLPPILNIYIQKQLTLLLAVGRTLTFTINGKDTGGKITGVQGEVHCAVQLFSVRDRPKS